MTSILEELNNAAKIVGAEITVIPPDEADRIRRDIISKYCTEERGFIWESFHDYVSVRAPFGWEILDEFVGENPVLMLFLPWQESSMVEFSNGSQIPGVLQESYGIEFYITNRETDYLICYNHHDYLIACGHDAIAWLLSRREMLEKAAEEYWKSQVRARRDVN
jgi:hypothetical protein